jgi:hypothetical protein
MKMSKVRRRVRLTDEPMTKPGYRVMFFVEAGLLTSIDRIADALDLSRQQFMTEVFESVVSNHRQMVNHYRNKKDTMGVIRERKK